MAEINLQEFLNNAQTNWSEIAGNDLAEAIKELQTSDSVFKSLQEKIETNPEFKEAVIESILSSYMELEGKGIQGLEQQNKLAGVYESLFQKEEEQLLTPDSAIGKFLQNSQKRKVLKEAMQSAEGVEVPQEAIGDIDYSKFNLHLLGKMARLSEEVGADLKKEEGVGSKIQSTLYGVAQVCLALIGMALAVPKGMEYGNAPLNVVQGNYAGAFLNVVSAWQYGGVQDVLEWTQNYLEKLEKKPQQEFIQTAGEVAKELQAVLTLESKQKKEQAGKEQQPQDKSVQEKPQLEHRKNLRKAKSFMEHVETSRKVAENLQGQGRH